MGKRKDAAITFKLPSDLKENFLKKCELDESVHSKVLRNLMRAYINMDKNEYMKFKDEYLK